MKPIVFLILAVLTLSLPAPGRAQGAGGAAARELAEFVMKRFGREAIEEGVEKLSGRITAMAARYGDEAVEAAVRRVGPRALSLADEAGEHGAQALRLLSRHGDDAAWLVGRPESLKLLSHYGDDAAEILIRHKAVAGPLASQLGKPAVQALGSLGPQAGRRLAMLAEGGELAATGRAGELLAVIRQYGDSAMDFVWRHKGALTVSTALAAFLQNPQPFIDGTASLTESVAVHAVQPVAVAAADAAQDAAGVSIRWLAIVIPAALLCWIAWQLFAERIRRALRPKPAEVDSDAP